MKEYAKTFVFVESGCVESVYLTEFHAIALVALQTRCLSNDTDSFAENYRESNVLLFSASQQGK